MNFVRMPLNSGLAIRAMLCRLQLRTSHTSPTFAAPVKVLYDGLCPICVTEIRFLQFLQKKEPGKVNFIDISLPGYDGAKHNGISYKMAMEEMHVIDEKNTVPPLEPIPHVLPGAVSRTVGFASEELTLEECYKVVFGGGILGIEKHFCAAKPWNSLPEHVHRGVPAFCVMYSAVGLGWLGRLLMWPPVRPLMYKSYDIFARNRLKWTGRGGECTTGRCEKKPN